MPGCAASARRLRSTNRPKFGRTASGNRVAIARTRRGAVISNSRSAVCAGPVEALFCLVARRKRTALRQAQGERKSERSEEHTSELQSLMRISYAVFCLKKTKKKDHNYTELPLSTPTHHSY